MSRINVHNSIQNAVKTPNGRPQVSRAEAQAITQAASESPRGAGKVTADEARLIGQVMDGDVFDARGRQAAVTAPGRQVLEDFAVQHGLPLGQNVEAMKARMETVLADADLSTPLPRSPSTSSLMSVTLSDGRPHDGALREALLNPSAGEFYLRTTVQGRGMRRPRVENFGPFKLEGTAPPSGGALDAGALGARVKAAAQDYWFPSETDARLTYLVGPGNAPVTAEGVRAAFMDAHEGAKASMFGSADSTPLADKFAVEVDAQAFFDRYNHPHDPADPVSAENSARFAQVEALLKANLSDLRVFRFSENDPNDHIRAPGQVSVFIAGRASSGELVGLMTAAVET